MSAEAVSRAVLHPLLSAPLELLLVEDDDGDAFLVGELLAEVAPDVRLRRVDRLSAAREALGPATSCVLLDLGLPDGSGLEALPGLIAAAPRAAVIVLTGVADEQLGLTAVGRGAQDYLAKGDLEPGLLGRTIRYALERKRTEDTGRRLAQSELLAEENRRLERGLLPTPLLRSGDVRVTSRYRPGRSRALLGGDFYDVVERPDGSLLAMIGDVCGHGPDEAALGVALRIGWRTLVLAGTPAADVLPALAELLVHERGRDEVFATACQVEVAADRRRAAVRLAGHPAPVLLGRAPLTAEQGLPLGVLDGARWAAEELDLPPGWALLLHTDGLVEGRVGDGPERLGTERLHDLLEQERAADPDPERWTDALVARVEALHGDALTDDVALLVLSRTAGA